MRYIIFFLNFKANLVQSFSSIKLNLFLCIIVSLGSTTLCKEISISRPSINETKSTTKQSESSISRPSRSETKPTESFISRPSISETKSTTKQSESSISRPSTSEIKPTTRETELSISKTAKTISANATAISTTSTMPVGDSKKIEFHFKPHFIVDKDKEFIESLFAIAKEISYPPFINAIIIAKDGLFTPRSLAVQVEAYVIYEDLSTISKENLQNLLEKVRQLKNKSTVCCLLFDLSSVSTIVNFSSCSFYGCREPLQTILGERAVSNSGPIKKLGI